MKDVVFTFHSTFTIFVSGTLIAKVFRTFLLSKIMEKTATNENFMEILSDTKPVLVDFWATWCGPCRALAPTVETIAEEYGPKATVAKCNVDDCEDIAVKYGIRNIPTLLFFKNGEVVDRLVGNVPKADIASKLDALI